MIIQIIANAIRNNSGGGHIDPTEGLLSDVHAIIRELGQAGFVIRPGNPTDEMIEAGWETIQDRKTFALSPDVVEVYSAMIGAFNDE